MPEAERAVKSNVDAPKPETHEAHAVLDHADRVLRHPEFKQHAVDLAVEIYQSQMFINFESWWNGRSGSTQSLILMAGRLNPLIPLAVVNEMVNAGLIISKADPTPAKVRNRLRSQTKRNTIALKALRYLPQTAKFAPLFDKMIPLLHHREKLYGQIRASIEPLRVAKKIHGKVMAANDVTANDVATNDVATNDVTTAASASSQTADATTSISANHAGAKTHVEGTSVDDLQHGETPTSNVISLAERRAGNAKDASHTRRSTEGGNSETQRAA